MNTNILRNVCEAAARATYGNKETMTPSTKVFVKNQSDGVLLEIFAAEIVIDSGNDVHVVLIWE